MWIVVGVLLLVSPVAAAPSARDLIAQGEVHEAKSEWDKALARYAELEKLPDQLGIAKYLEARVYFLRGDLARSQTLVVQAVRSLDNVSRKYDAKLLYGEILFKQGLYHRAKDVFLTLRQQEPRKPELEQRVIACNKALKRPDREGL